VLEKMRPSASLVQSVMLVLGAQLLQPAGTVVQAATQHMVEIGRAPSACPGSPTPRDFNQATAAGVGSFPIWGVGLSRH
jgi:hypothetical protein